MSWKHFTSPPSSIPSALACTIAAFGWLAPDSAAAHGGIRSSTLAGGPRGIHVDTEADGTIWVRGRTYKARFDGRGAAYIPFLGSRAPKDFPLELALVGASGDAGELDLAPASRAVLDGGRVVIDRGPIDEVYELGLDSIEHTFVIEAPPEVSGSLWLQVSVTGELAPSVAGGGFAFLGVHGGATYGAAFLREPNGGRRAIESRLADRIIEIEVPRSELDRASYPLVVDPVVSTFAVDVSARDSFNADVAWDNSTDRMMIVMEEIFSATDHDVYVEFSDLDGNQVGSGYADSSAADWREPRCANLDHADQFMIVATEGTGAGNLLRGRSTPASSIAFEPKFTIDSGAVTEKLGPDIGTDPRQIAAAGYCVTYATSFGGGRDTVWATLDRNGVHGAFGNANGASPNSKPTISGSNNGSEWVIMDRSGAINACVVWAWTVDTSGAVVVGGIVSNVAGEFSQPAVATPLDDGRILLGWQESFGATSNINLKLLDASLATLDQRVITTLEGASTLSEDQRNLSLESDGESVVAVYAESVGGSTTNYDVILTEIIVLNDEMVGWAPHLQVTPNTNGDRRPQVTSAYASGGSRNEFGFAWDREITATDRNVLAGFYDGAEGGPAVAFCFGDGTGAVCPCANNGLPGHGCQNSDFTGGAVLAASGIASLSNDTLVLTASSERPTALSVFLQGSVEIAPVLYGDGLRCTGGSLKRLYSHNAVGGTVSAPQGADLSITARSAALGAVIPAYGTRLYQAYYRDPLSTFCPIPTGSTFNATNGLRVIWGP